MDAPVTLLRRAKILKFYFSFCNKKKKKGRRKGGRKEGKNYLKGEEYIFSLHHAFSHFYWYLELHLLCNFMSQMEFLLI